MDGPVEWLVKMGPPHRRPVSTGKSGSCLTSPSTHVIDAVPAFLLRRDLVHVNPSVVLSCLLHLAYEREKKNPHSQVHSVNHRPVK